MQEVHLDKNIKLLDCPGVVMLRSGENEASVALRNCERIEKLEDSMGPVKEILKLCPAKVLVALYKLPSFDSVDDFLQKWPPSGLTQSLLAFFVLFPDKIPYYTMPATRNQEEPSEAKIVSELGKEFNIDEIYSSESSFIGSLKSFDDVKHVEVPPNCPLNFDEQILEDDVKQQPSNEGNDLVNDGDDEHMGSEEDVAAAEVKAKNAGRRQNEKLYDAAGILSTKLMRAGKKRWKKANKSSGDAMEDDEDYDFKVDYVKKGSAMDDGEENEEAGGSNQTRFEVLASGVEIDE
ncbi:hypothetical protein RHSIM_Rhsim09G0001800 [Rhododendron simsii]|uniref:Uncharacterized protein n=1 Tax=Rhododendron simsii TaxID=118357 RepID=A0A834GHX6_RHOSS|nr:hypothetical protein RHSIM_Rhsim09G0001800 [Rhododendron simsii]